MKKFLPLLGLLVAVVGYKYYSWQRAEQAQTEVVSELPTSIDTSVDVQEQVEALDSVTETEVREEVVRTEESAA